MTGVTLTTSTAFLKDVVAYVDVWSASRMEDYSDPFIKQLQDMGAQVSKTLNKQVTHVIFKHGRPSTWKKALKIGVKIVSVHWVARCKETNQHINEELFPAQNEESKRHLTNKRTHCCMQPRNIPIKTPENDRRLKRKIDKMMEGLVPSSPIVSDTSPFIIDEERGIVYSPSLKRSDSMAQRLKEMKAGREHLSPTASQKQDIGSEHDPSPPASTALSFLQQLEEEPLDPFSVSHCDALKKRGEREKLNCIKKSIVKISRKQVNHKPSESDACNRVSDERGIENPLSSKSELGLLSKTRGSKQTTLKNFLYETSSEREESSNLKPETKNTGMSTELYASSEKPRSFLPKSLTKAIRRKSVHNCKELLTNSECLYSSKSSSENEHIFQKDESMIDKPMQKRQRRTSAGLHSASLCALPSREISDDELFEDFFSPANNASKKRVVLFDLTSDAMPTFDLEDSNKKGRRKSYKKQKHGIKDSTVASSDSVNTTEESVLDARESRSERVAVGKSSRFVEMKLEPSPKEQRTRSGC